MRSAGTRLLKSARLLDEKKKWPTVLGSDGNQTDRHYSFRVALKQGASPDLQNQFAAAGGK
jgi:hypothetical protein